MIRLLQDNRKRTIIHEFTVPDASFSQTALKGEVGKNKQKNQEVAKI